MLSGKFSVCLSLLSCLLVCPIKIKSSTFTPCFAIGPFWCSVDDGESPFSVHGARLPPESHEIIVGPTAINYIFYKPAFSYNWQRIAIIESAILGVHCPFLILPVKLFLDHETWNGSLLLSKTQEDPCCCHCTMVSIALSVGIVLSSMGGISMSS